MHEISDVRDFPQTMTVEDIYSIHIGTINIKKNWRRKIQELFKKN